ncbi:MAG: glycosyltransferase family 2 protein, partial [Candidatus Gribaldobacteria bacterium]|nr:glycosyltransferase family 2 protein [Candidatus Gribaldobacteria bacterium]
MIAREKQKRNRGEEKDIKDLLLMDPLIRPEISIIILNYNGLEHIKACIESIEKNTEETYEIIIVDNASTDGSLEYLGSIKNTILIINKENIGCPPARALALPLAKGNFVVLLDNDTIVTEGWIAKFKAHCKRYPDIGILGPRSNYVSGAQLVQNVPYTDVSGLDVFARKWADDHAGLLIPTHRLVGFCMFISRAVIEKIGNIDAGFGKFGFEDDDYTWRTIIAGFKTAIANDVFIHHSGGPQGQGNSGYNQRLLDAWEYYKKKWDLPVDLRYGVAYNI